MDARPEWRAERLRRMYAGGRADRTARALSRLWARLFAWGLLPRRWVTLEVPGRVTGRTTRFPLGMADVGGRWYLVSMLGDSCNWVRNVRAADGVAVLRRRRPRPVRLVEVPVERRAPVIRRYLEKVPGGRPHIAVSADAPEAEIERVARDHPVFEVVARPQTTDFPA
ncbi:MAG TPA: nitroreductase/quinone reductase family protein [Solirubrobacterales bacterium]|nr:nitroreductase/quinone reductase family protein [Solirubrobacterales bacterium]